MPVLASAFADIVMEIADELGASYTVSDAIATAAEYAVVIGGSLAYSNYMKKMLARQGQPGAPVMLQDSTYPRNLVYGCARVSGAMAFITTTGSSNQYLHIVLPIAVGPLTSIDNIYFGSDLLQFDAYGNITGCIDINGNSTTKYAGKGLVHSYLGAASQAADSTLIAACPSLWTVNHKLNGIAYLYIQMQYDSSYSGGIPNVTADVHGLAVFDPRTAITQVGSTSLANEITVASSTGITVGMVAAGPGIPNNTTVTGIAGTTIALSNNWTSAQTGQTYYFGNKAWSQNSALCTADYLAQPIMGLAVPYIAGMDVNELISAANTCDQPITLADGVTVINRYTLNGSISTDTTPESILNNMAATMAGTLVYSAGTWFIQAGAWRTPFATAFSERDFVGPISVAPRLSRRDGCNSTKGTYIEPTQSWANIDGQPHQNSTYIAQDNNQVIWHDLALPLVTSGPTATRLFKIDVERTRREMIVTCATTLKGLQVRAGDSILVNFAKYGWVNQEFEVTEWNLTMKATGKDGVPTPAVAMSLRQIDSGVFTWANGEEGTYTFAGDTILPNPFNIANPTGLTLLANDSTSWVQNDGTFQPRLLVSWTAPLDQFTLVGGKIEIQYKQSSSGTWLEWDRVDGSITSDYITDVLPNTSYDVQVRSVNQLGIPAATWVQSLGYTVPNKQTPPVVSAGGSLNSSGVTPYFLASTQVYQFGTRVTWNPIVQPDLAYYEVKATTTDSDSATDYAWAPSDGNPTLKTPAGGQMYGCLYNPVLNAGYVRVRGVDRFGNTGPWLRIGNANSAASLGTGTIATQPQSGANLTALTIGNLGSGGSPINAVAHGTTVLTLVGGSTSETHYITIAGFTAKPMQGQVEVASDDSTHVRYNYDDTGNSATQAAVVVSKFSGAVLGSGILVRVSYHFAQ